MILSAGRKPRLSSRSAPGPVPLETHKKKRSLTGFTLIELALVAVIILAIITLSTPLFRRTIAELSIRDASYNISKLINYAQERAIIDNTKNFKVRFYLKNKQYKFVEIGTDPVTKSPVEIKVAGKFGKLFTLPKGITFTRDEKPGAQNVDIAFYPDGHCTKADIYLYDAGKMHYKISTKGFGGLVEVSEEVKK